PSNYWKIIAYFFKRRQAYSLLISNLLLLIKVKIVLDLPPLGLDQFFDKGPLIFLGSLARKSNTQNVQQFLDQSYRSSDNKDYPLRRLNKDHYSKHLEIGILDIKGVPSSVGFHERLGRYQ